MALLDPFKKLLTPLVQGLTKKPAVPTSTKAVSPFMSTKAPVSPFQSTAKPATGGMSKVPTAPIPLQKGQAVPAGYAGMSTLKGPMATPLAVGTGVAAGATFQKQPVPQVKASAPAPAPTRPVTPTVSRGTPAPAYTPPAPQADYSGAPAGTERKQKPTKPVVPQPSAAEKAVADAEKLYQESMRMSADELATQGDLDRLNEATQKGYTGIKDKAIPLEFITGQLRATEERALDLAQPLETRLARMEAQRKNSLEASKFALERADTKLTAERDAAKPVTIGGALVQKDPVTGEYKTVYQAPETEKRSATYQEYLDAKKEGYTGSFDTYRNESSGLTTNQQYARIDKIANNFGDEPVVKRYSTIAEGWSFANAIPDDSTNPADNQALIYAFAKAMDPDSVVREGEYATVQKYAQTWLDNFGFNAARIVNNQEFLTKEAVQNVKATIKQRYDASEKAYRNIYGTYASRMREAGGDPSQDLVDYSKPLTGGVGTLEDFYRTNPEKRATIDQMIQENPDLSDDDILEILSGGFSSGGVGATNRPQRNNNPLNIKSSSYTQAYPGVVGTDPSPATDGGQFLVFDSPESGFEAAKTLLQTGGYRNLTVDAAMRRWSGSGYGGEITPALKDRTVASLSAQEIQDLVDSMARREGYYA